MTEPWFEKGQFIWKCFTFAPGRLVSNNKLICPTISIGAVIICSAGTLLQISNAEVHLLTYTKTLLFSFSQPQVFLLR